MSEQRLSESRPGAEPFVLRRFMASQLDAFGKYYTRLGSDAKRHCNEVVTDGPCKAFCDFEMPLSRASVAKHGCASVAELVAECERSTDALLDAMVAYHREQGIDDPEPIVLKAHAEHKWSRHVIFANAVWRHVTHVGNFVRHQCRQLAGDYPLLRTESCSLVDTGIYHRMRCMRIYRSSKAKEPQRSFTYERGPQRYAWHVNERSIGSVNSQLVLDSLITAIPLPPLPKPARQPDADDTETDDDDATPDTERKFVTTTFLERFPHVIAMIKLRPLEFAAPAPTTTPSGGDGGDADDQASVVSENSDNWRAGVSRELYNEVRALFARYDPYNVRVNGTTGLVCVDCRSKACPFVGREHGSNHVYVLVDMLAGRCAVHCYHPQCRPQRRRWQPLPDDSFGSHRDELCPGRQRCETLQDVVALPAV
jgi:hypothetical protein